MFNINGLDRCAQPIYRILSVEPPVADDVGVLQVNELHSAATGFAQSSHAVPVLNTGPSQVNGIS